VNAPDPGMTEIMKLVYKVDGRIQAIIERDEAAGFYLFIFDLESGSCTHDHLQDTLATALAQAEEDYALASDNWQPMP
jgi:hypothetical protein